VGIKLGLSAKMQGGFYCYYIISFCSLDLHNFVYFFNAVIQKKSLQYIFKKERKGNVVNVPFHAHVN
jgi:hypothetical protein